MNNVSVTAKDGIPINALTLGFDKADIKAVVIICHGFGEHSGSYVELAERLFKSNFASIIHDQRGHGQPPDNISTKEWFGRIPEYQCFVDDVISLTEYVHKTLPGIPVMLYGHSMGGNIVVNTLLRLPHKPATEYVCAVLESPWFDLYNPPLLFLKGLMKLISMVMPNFRIKRKMNSDEFSTVSDRADGYIKDPLHHGVLTAKMFTGIFGACKYALLNAGRLPIPTFLAYADDDTIVCNEAIKNFAEKAGKIVEIYEYESKHAIHNDANRENFFDDVVAYMELCLK